MSEAKKERRREPENERKQDLSVSPSLPHSISLLPLSLLVALALGCQHRSILSDPDLLSRNNHGAGYTQTLVLQAGRWAKPAEAQPGTPEADLERAHALFRAEEYAKAEQAFAEVVKKYPSEVRTHEEAMFMKGETQFEQSKYTKARDSYEALLEQYSGSRYLSAAVQRLYAIADSWLEQAREDVRQGRPAEFPQRFVQIDPGRKPLFDIDGHALQLLKTVREREPNGPLADESLMVSAGYRLNTGNFRKADELYDQLIHQYPNSAHQPEAHLLSAQAKLNSYKGSRYDGRKLEEARRLLQAGLRQFPAELEVERQRIYQNLDLIRQEAAKREFQVAEWYRRMGKTVSAQLYYQLVLKKYPGTKWSERAASRLVELDDKAAGHVEPKETQLEIGRGGEGERGRRGDQSRA